MLHLQIVPQNKGIAALHARGHGAAHVGKRLVPVEPAQLDVFPVQHEALRSEARIAETDAGGVFVDRRAALVEARGDGIKPRVVEVPQFDGAEFRKSQGLSGTVLRRRISTRAPSRNSTFKVSPSAGASAEQALHLHAPAIAQNLHRFGENVFDEHRRRRCAARLHDKCRRRSGSRCSRRRVGYRAVRWNPPRRPARSSPSGFRCGVSSKEKGV